MRIYVILIIKTSYYLFIIYFMYLNRRGIQKYKRYVIFVNSFVLYVHYTIHIIICIII